jgi:phenylpropionate dioxygenase-like ring-hydroxylating dioxygenase large terminal subunit
MTAFPRNVWYMAGWGHEVGRSLFRRRLFDRAIVLFREQGGTVRAISDRCPHRFVPLGLGELREDVVVCPYHGLSFDGLGQCVKNPYSDRIPAGARVDAWTCVERHGIIWLWGGDHESADALSIPDFSMVEDNVTTRVVRGYTLLEAPYEFGTDNLMDLSHIEFVHKGSFAGNGVIFAGTHSIVDDGDSLHSNWWMPDVVAPPHTVGVYPPEMRTDHWLDMRWNAPASMKLEIGACPVGGERSGGLVAQQAHILTPAGPETTHYFWATTRNHDLESAETDLFLKQLFAQAFDEEDKPIIKAAYENLEGMDFWSAKPLSLGIDGGGTRARRKVEALVRAEAVQAP